jgi:hypothetical protein
VNTQRLLPIGVTLIAVLVIAVGWGLSESDADLLDLDNPTDEQIGRIVAMLTTQDDNLYARVEDKLVDLKERSVQPLETFALEGRKQAYSAITLLNAIEPEANRRLATTLYDQTDPGLRASAFRALDGFKGEPESVALWARAVEDSEAPIRMLAASLLGETAGAHRGVAAEALKKLRTDPDDDVREHAAEALTMLDGRDHAAEFNVK